MIAGVYGAGKSTICKRLSLELNLKFFSASELIKSERGSVTWCENKKTDKIESNQQYLVNAVNKLKRVDFLLDGHFCLLDGEGNIIKLNFNVINKLNLGAILLLKENAEVICKRLLTRDNKFWDEITLSELLHVEEEQASKFAIENNIPFESFYSSDYCEIKGFISSLYKEGTVNE